ncbi:MAG: hypothetical protein V4540_11390 [Pseudomonadota bacterium]
MRAVSTLIAIGTALWVAAPPAQAVGFGRVSNATQLGQPLDFVAAVRLDPDEVLPPECVSAEVQSGENRLGQGQVRVALEGPADSSLRSVRVSTTALIDEPVVTVSVTLGCTAKITRRFVAFIDPPLINAPQTAPVEAPVPPQRIEPQAAVSSPPPPRAEPTFTPGSTAPTGRGAAPRPRARAPVPTALGPRAAAAARRTAAEPRADNPQRSAATSRQPRVAARAAPPGPRLQLEAAAPVVARSASTPASGPGPAPLIAAEPASAPKPEAVAEPLAVERQRIQALEEGLAKLTKDSQAAQAALNSVQARLKEAESQRYANPLVYVLAGLSALLALLVVFLWWRQARAQGLAQWWAGPAPAASPTTLAAGAAAAMAAAELEEASRPDPVATPPTPAGALAVSRRVEANEAPAPQPVRELSVEELIDLEQQADFFVVLGQDEAAIDLLMSHVRTDGSNSPLPYLKLLEIYRRRGEGEAYQRIRERFNRRFNARAPEWDADPGHGRSLADYPETVERLQGLWSAPTRTMQVLKEALFRRDTAGPTYDLPAYGELLFLYAIARDLAERGDPSPSVDVDLLLPLEHAGTPSPPRGGTLDAMARGEQTAALAPPGTGGQPDTDGPHFVDFNLDLPAPPAASADGKR